MIPAYLNDGFTTEPVEGVFCRPMLWEDRQQWKAIAAVNMDEAIQFVMDFAYGDKAEEHKVAVIQEVCGYTAEMESKDFQDLHDSVYLQYVNPGMSTLSCDTCREYCVNHKTGEVYIAANGKPQPLLKNAVLPCEDTGCVKVHWSNPLGVSNARWALTWKHYWTFKGASVLARDAVYRRNSALINWIVEHGRDRRFDPFAGGVSFGRTADDSAKGTNRPLQDGAGSQRGGCSTGKCSTRRCTRSTGCKPRSVCSSTDARDRVGCDSPANGSSEI